MSKYAELEDRTSKFGDDIFRLSKRIPRNMETFPILDQILRSSRSIGANYVEANESHYPADKKI